MALLGAAGAQHASSGDGGGFPRLARHACRGAERAAGHAEEEDGHAAVPRRTAVAAQAAGTVMVMLGAKPRSAAGRRRGDATCVAACAASQNGSGLGDVASCGAGEPSCRALYAAGIAATAESSAVERVARVGCRMPCGA